jgi:murein DD-endopeptidase MepM/ murein hydrolase activator NlpD
MMPEEDLAKDPDTVALYMENNNFVEQDTTTGLPPGYTPPSPKESANLAVSLLNGFTTSFYDNRAALYTAPSGDYAKYLDYCVYRAFPWGKTYEESGALGSAEDEWKTGENCLLRQNDPKNPSLGTKISNFRIYTLDRNTNDASEPPSEVYSDTQATVNPGGTDVPTLPDGTWIWPVNGPIMQFWGHWNASRNGAHKGIDIGVPPGTPVKVAHSGTVVSSGATYNDPSCGYMVTLLVDGSNPAIYENYQHLSPTGPLPSGHYNAGQVLGKVASMSELNHVKLCSSGPHLHFQIQKVDSFIVGYSSALSLTEDPLKYLPPKP